MQQTHYTPGRFVWHELVTSDIEAARRFYGELVGWHFERDCSAPQPYMHLTQNGQRVGAMVQRPGPHVPPHVLGFVSVLDLDGVLEHARTHRAAVLVPPLHTPIGPAAVLQDPQGAVLGLCRAIDGAAPVPQTPQVGSFCWSQLNTSDAQRAAAFYSNVFSWHNDPHDAIEGRSAFTQGTRRLAGLVQATQGTFAHWLTYLSVDNLERARVLTRQLGGSIMIETTDLAGIGQAVVVQDSVGTIIGLVEPTR